MISDVMFRRPEESGGVRWKDAEELNAGREIIATQG